MVRINYYGLLFAGDVPGFSRWLDLPDLDPVGPGGNVRVAVFTTNNGLQLTTDGIHTLSSGSSGQLYNAFVYGHGPAPRHTSYGYLAGYDRKRNFMSAYHVFEMFNIVNQIQMCCRLCVG